VGEQAKKINNLFCAAKSTKQGAQEGFNTRQRATMRLDWANLSFSAKHKPQFRYKGIAVFVFLCYTVFDT
jgi:hypothetical protein